MRFHHWAVIGKAATRSLKFFPLCSGKEHQTTMGMSSDCELPSCRCAQHIAMTRGHRQATLGIQIQRWRTLKHSKQPLGDTSGFGMSKNFTFFHQIPLICTLTGFRILASLKMRFLAVKSIT
jgi:hypothetical protein